MISHIRARSLDIGPTLIKHYVRSPIRGFRGKPGANPLRFAEYFKNQYVTRASRSLPPNGSFQSVKILIANCIYLRLNPSTRFPNGMPRTRRGIRRLDQDKLLMFQYVQSPFLFPQWGVLTLELLVTGLGLAAGWRVSLCPRACRRSTGGVVLGTLKRYLSIL